MCLKDAHRIANSEGPDQTAPSGPRPACLLGTLEKTSLFFHSRFVKLLIIIILLKTLFQEGNAISTN